MKYLRFLELDYFSLPFDRLLLRYYLMMAVTIIPFLIGIPVLALLAVPVFLTCITAVKIRFRTASEMNEINNTSESKEINMHAHAA